MSVIKPFLRKEKETRVAEKTCFRQKNLIWYMKRHCMRRCMPARAPFIRSHGCGIKLYAGCVHIMQIDPETKRRTACQNTVLPPPRAAENPVRRFKINRMSEKNGFMIPPGGYTASCHRYWRLSPCTFSLRWRGPITESGSGFSVGESPCWRWGCSPLLLSHFRCWFSFTACS